MGDTLGAAIRRIVREELVKLVELEIILGTGATMPSQPYTTDACWDLYAVRRTKIPCGMTTEVSTGVYMNIPEGYEGELKTRSSWGKNGLIVHHSVFDSGYQGEVTPFVHNLSHEDFEVNTGERVAQFVLRKKVNVRWKQVAGLSPSDRGTKGHGSSGR